MIKAPDFIADYSIGGWKKLNVVVVGAGGTGSALLNKIFQMQVTLSSLGAEAFQVKVFDDDVVSPSNVGRQCFWPVDIDAPKAQILVDRYNRFGNVRWEAVCEKFSCDRIRDYDGYVVFGCVDNVEARKDIHRWFASHRNAVWIDCGNDNRSANVFMGVNATTDGERCYVPSVYDLFKKQMDSSNIVNEPSCSTAEAIERQDFGVNDITAAQAVQMLWQLIRHGQVGYQGVTIDLPSGTSSPIEADPAIWEMFGYQTNKDAA